MDCILYPMSYNILYKVCHQISCTMNPLSLSSVSFCVYSRLHTYAHYVHTHRSVHTNTNTCTDPAYTYVYIYRNEFRRASSGVKCLAIEINVHIVRYTDRVQGFYRTSVCKGTFLLQPFSDSLFQKPFIYLDLCSFVSCMAPTSHSCFLRRMKERGNTAYTFTSASNVTWYFIQTSHKSHDASVVICTLHIRKLRLTRTAISSLCPELLQSCQAPRTHTESSVLS